MDGITSFRLIRNASSHRAGHRHPRRSGPVVGAHPQSCPIWEVE
jgi:hypothetical protein